MDKTFSSKDRWALGVLGAVLIFSFFFGGSDGRVHIYFLDVGQGDAVFIKTTKGRQILVDGGPDRTVLRRLGEVMPFYDRSINMVVATHPDADHLAGLIDVLKSYRVETILETGMQCATSFCEEWERIKPAENAEIISAKLGQEIEADGLKISVLHPFENIQGKEIKPRNNGAVVLKLTYGKQTLLLTADIEKKVEEKLRLSGINLASDFLKVAHHGSHTSTTEGFLKAVSPQLAFIEAGKNNRYGHPHPDVVSRLANLGIKYYRSDTDGTKELVLDGEDYLIK